MPLRKYRYKREGEELGPLDESIMRTLIASGELAPDDLVWSEDHSEWIAASEVFVFPKKKAVYQVPPQLAHPPTKYELSMPWIFTLIGVLAVCAFVLIWSIHQDSGEPVQPVSPDAVVTPVAPKKKTLTAVDRSIEEMMQTAAPKKYDELVAALESPPAPPPEFERQTELVQWWTAYSQLYERYWNALTQVQQQRVSEEVLAKWRAPWNSSRLFVREVRGEVKEVKPTAKIPDIPPECYVVELQQGSLLNCVLYDSEQEVAQISKGGPFQANELRVIKISDGEISRLFPDQRRLIIWYVSDKDK